MYLCSSIDNIGVVVVYVCDVDVGSILVNSREVVRHHRRRLAILANLPDYRW